MISIEQVALKYKIVIFDFDDTLVHEKDFLLLVYHQISSYVAHKYGINGKDIFLFLKDEFFRNGREKILDKLIFKYNLDKDSISDFLHIMRTIEINPKLKIKPICNFFFK